MATSRHGRNLIAGERVPGSGGTFQGIDSTTGHELAGEFEEAGSAEISAAVAAASQASAAFRDSESESRVALLDGIAGELEASADDLVARAMAETGYPEPRIRMEIGRAAGQARQFADYVREGIWRDARIDLPDPSREPVPKPDVRSHREPVGPVVVFGASNFPIAISVAGADTVAALAAGCPVIVKAHPGHPGTCEIAAEAVNRAVAASGLAPGIFSLLQGSGHELGAGLVEHPDVRAVAFTGSLAGGRALADLAASRPHPIPFYGELGSTNPIFLLPGALAENAEGIAAGFVGSLNLGVGQFCTNPGLVLGLDGAGLNRFRDRAAEGIAATAPATMLHPGIHHAYVAGCEKLESLSSGLVAKSAPTASGPHDAVSALYEIDGAGLLAEPAFHEEIFGPASTLARCVDPGELVEFARQLEGSLTASVHGTEADLAEHGELVSTLRSRVGRLIFNGFPTGIEVCHAMHHGGPWPASTHSGFTSIGTRTIDKFTRPVCYQNFPQSGLPQELRDDNPLGLPRLVDGVLNRGPITG